MQWSVQGRYPHNNFAQESSLFVPNSAYAGYAQQVQNGVAYNTNSSLAYPIQYSPRSYNGLGFSGIPSDMATSYPPATFFHSPPQLQDTLSLPEHDVPDLVQLNDDFDMQYTKQDDQHDYMDSYPDMSRASTPYSNMHEDDNPIDKEQPYAQLIYRALLDAPNHTMILRDIYDWFRRYTDKAAQSETKGWQNSIRHNLSMNGAFEKVDSPSDSTSKGFMWRLTANALREGVKSTTRYRSKAPNKRSSTRSQPLPQRQASGAKGGHAARRAANHRRSQRAREAYPRSNPYSGYGSEWEGESVYGGDSSYPTRADSPYPQYSGSGGISFSPYSMQKEADYASTPLNYPSTPMTSNSGFMGDAAYVLEQGPGEPLFSTSPTPSGDEPVTPHNRQGTWEEDIAMRVDVYDELQYHGHAS
ncbi:hypothetical protein EJ07DRAFT_99571 [Lizonia empirigonia]|nr:hypothetical protein EJ07DRAFT_99571 [Lizonia empirigonia]